MLGSAAGEGGKRLCCSRQIGRLMHQPLSNHERPIGRKIVRIREQGAARSRFCLRRRGREIFKN